MFFGYCTAYLLLCVTIMGMSLMTEVLRFSCQWLFIWVPFPYALPPVSWPLPVATFICNSISWTYTFKPRRGISMFHQNVSICLQDYLVSQPRISESESLDTCKALQKYLLIAYFPKVGLRSLLHVCMSVCVPLSLLGSRVSSLSRRGISLAV